MMSRFAQAKATGSFDQDISVSDTSDIDDPFESHTPKAAAAARPASAAPKTSSSGFSGLVKKAAQPSSGLSDSDAYSEDEFAQDKSPVAASKPAAANASKLAGIFGSAKPAAASKPEPTRGRTRDRDSSRSRSPSRSPSPFSAHSSPKPRAKPRSRSRSASRSRSRSPRPAAARSSSGASGGGGMSRLKALLTKKRETDEKDNGKPGSAPRAKSFMDVQKEKLESNPHYMKKQREITLKKMAAAGFMASSKTVDYSTQVSGLLSDIKNCSFKPVLSKGTRELLEKGGGQPEFSERLKMYITAKQDKLKAGAKLNHDTFTFAPKLNHLDGARSDDEQKDAEAKRREFQERTAQDLKRRKEELAAKQRALESECTFAPKLSVLPKRTRSKHSTLSQSFLKRYEKDLDKRDAGIEAKLAAARLAAHPYAPQINPAIAVQGSFLERTVKDVELRNKKMRYRAKLMDLTPPVHGHISVPPPEEDPFLLSEQARLKREKAAALAAAEEVKQLEKQLARSQSARGGLSATATGAFHVQTAGASPSKSGGWAALTGALKTSASLSRIRPSSALPIGAAGPALSIPRAPARPSMEAHSPPRRGQRMSAADLAEYKRGIRERKRAEEARQAAARGGHQQASGQGSASSSRSSSRRSSRAPSSERKPSKGHAKPAQRRVSSRSRSRSRSHSRSRSASPRPSTAGAGKRAGNAFAAAASAVRGRNTHSRSRSASPRSGRGGRRQSTRSPSRSRSRSPPSGGTSQSSSPFASRKKTKSSGRRRASRSRSTSRSRSPSPLRSRSSSRSVSPRPSHGRRR